MMDSNRLNQIKSWQKHRKTPFRPFQSLGFLHKPITSDFHKEMELESLTLNVQEEHDPPPIRTFDIHDLPFTKCTKFNLPHWSLVGSTYFVTFCIQNRSDKILLQPEAAQLIEEAFYFHNGKQYEIDAYVIMPDHVHLLITPFREFQLDVILSNMKRFTAGKINKILEKQGKLWQAENFDHLVRNHGYWVRYFDYIHYNPIKAGLAKTPEEYPWSSLHKWYK